MDLHLKIALFSVVMTPVILCSFVAGMRLGEIILSLHIF